MSGRRTQERVRYVAKKSPDNKKGPENRGLEAFLILISALAGAPKRLLLLFCGGLFLRGGFLSCALHRFVSP
jgi:hypothetical protein